MLEYSDGQRVDHPELHGQGGHHSVLVQDDLVNRGLQYLENPRGLYTLQTSTWAELHGDVHGGCLDEH
jgi:hypothetical protein